jgi:uncharacterized membrane protein YhiD involved in acid resistance
MWVTCSIGLALGSGYYLFGTATAGITIVALLGLKVFEKKLTKDWYREMVIVSEDLENQLDRIQEVIGKSNVKVINFSLKKDLQKKEMTASFRFRLRAVQPNRDILKDVFGIEGIKRVELQ